MERHKLTHAPPEVKEGKYVHVPRRSYCDAKLTGPERMFQCTDCTYKTLQESNLKAHQNTQ